MFFGGNNGILGAPLQQQGVNELQGYERRMNPGQGRVLSSNPMSYGQPGFQLTPQTNPFNPGQPPPAGMAPPVNGAPVTAPLPQGAGGMPVPAGVTPPSNPGESGVPGATAPDTGDPIVDGMLQNGMLPTSIPLKSEMSLGDRMAALGMVLSAAGTPQFGQVAGAVNAGIMQRTQGIEKYNRDLMALTKPRTVQKTLNNQLFEATIQPSYKYNPDTNSLEQLPPPPALEWKQIIDARDTQAEPKRETAKSADGYLRFTDTGELVYPDQYEEGVDISAEGVMSAQRFLRQEIDKDITPIENEINQINLAAQTAAAVYMDPESTDADKTEADRALVKLVEKLWDPTSAVLGGEFETAQAAQGWFDQKMRQFDLTSGESLGADKRRALLGVLRSVGEQKANIYNDRARDLTSRAGSTFGRYKDSQVAGAIEGSLPEAWRTAPDGTVGGAGDYYDRGLDPAWEEMMQSRWWTGNAPLKTDTTNTNVDAELENAAAEIIKSYSNIYMGSGR